jgi:hypothetical protein
MPYSIQPTKLSQAPSGVGPDFHPRSRPSRCGVESSSSTCSEDDVFRPIGVNRTIADTVNDLALLVEHVVVLEQALADGSSSAARPFSARFRSSG